MVCGMQHNGQTNVEFRYRWNNYKDNNGKSLRGEGLTQTYVFAHFQTASQSGFINDMKIRFINKMDPSDPSRRKDVVIHSVLVILTMPLVDDFAFLQANGVFTSTYFL